MIQQALILAAGLGTRMRPITDTIPKPMVEILGQSLVTKIIDQLYKFSIRKIVINLFYKGEILQKHVEEYVKNNFSDLDLHFVIEDELHEIWGSVKKILPYMNNQPFFIVNGDNYWIDRGEDIFDCLHSKWQETDMNALLLFYPKEQAIGYEGKGDFNFDQDGRVVFPITEPLPFVYIGIQIISPEFIWQEKLEKCNIFNVYARLNYRDVYATIYSGYWFHIGTPRSITETELFIKEHGLLSFR
jgi:MurNAc alpha-1-phosphate uridylyltransferase